ncbi:hypothetical protein PTQ21_18655 [Paenibacillus marchantiae]|uniref:hypothetical protein n=1 Tax=Paenibacillus marchantiae TaxID=3026433 RepID=UPI00237A3D59|nr:hypothetical protein [Paenibacillus marchantiae]WDQ30460.1 hypothetical protein PTQ21_18655 [Paenibacillus marchantiae]
MRDQIIKRLVLFSVKFAIRSEKGRLYGMILGSPRWVSGLIFAISVYQLSTLNTLNADLQQIISLIIAIVSFINFAVDLLSEKRQKFNEKRQRCDNLLSELSTLYINLINDKLNHDRSSETLSVLENYEKEFSKETAFFYFLSDKRTL